MALINRTFGGKLNYDDSDYRISPNDYTDALNITRDSQDNGQDEVVSNIVGNQLVNYTLPDGVNKVIGNKPDVVRNRIYYWVWNSNGYNLWLYYDNNNNSIVKLIEDLTDTDSDPVLDFDPSFRITHADIIYRDEGDLISWVAGNTSPKEANVQTIIDGGYGIIKKEYIEAAKKPPLTPPSTTYGTDTTKTGNALRRKLFQFCYAYKYDTYAMSTPSSFSKVALPIGTFGSDVDIDDNSNNYISVTITTGAKNVTDIFIYMRYNIGDAWSDFSTIATLNKEQLNIIDNGNYQYLFYNDKIYPPPQTNFQYLSGVQSVPLFDWVPQKALTQALANGQYKVYGSITEGYDNYPASQLDVTLTAANKTNIPPDNSPPSLPYISEPGLDIDGDESIQYFFTVTGNVPVGTYYEIIINSVGVPTTIASYTSVLGDTVNEVAQALYDDLSPNYLPGLIGTEFSFTVLAGEVLLEVIVTPGSDTGDNISTAKTWLWDCPYAFGLVYVDEQNRDMPGVTTFSNPTNTDNDFIVNTPSFSADGGSAQTPVISFSINHVPPEEAVAYYIVRRRLQYGTFMFYQTCDYQKDPDGDDDLYLYFCLDNVKKFKEDNNQFIYSEVPITSESRIKIICQMTSGAFEPIYFNEDYQILGTVTRTLTGGTSPDDDVPFIKVLKPETLPVYYSTMLVMVYTPMQNPTNEKDSVYYEWGEKYNIYTAYVLSYTRTSGTFQVGQLVLGVTSGAKAIILADNGSNAMTVRNVEGHFIVGENIIGGVGATGIFNSLTEVGRYHQGQTQDQTDVLPATFTFTDGDVYFHLRQMYSNILSGAPNHAIHTASVMEANYSDYFDSLVNDNGRAQVVEANARNQFNPVLLRFGEGYQSGTTINGLNRFYFENYIEADRSWDKIVKLFIDRKYMYVGQVLNTGIVPIFQQVVFDTAGNPLQANSETLLNKIQYPYDNQYGFGNVPESFAYGKKGIYGVDNNKGIVFRLSVQSGTVAISVVYNCNAFFVDKLKAYKETLNNGNAPNGGVYTGDPTCYGVFDSYTNKYILALEEINRYNEQGYLTFHQDPNTISFLETDNAKEGFESPYSYHPENISSLNNLLVSFKDGQLWAHNSSTYCNFYGVQYDAFIQMVFNDGMLQKKTWESLMLMSDTKFDCPIIYTNALSYPNQKQESSLIEDDFETFEPYPSASFYRDKNSIGGILNGDWLKGSFIVIKFQKTNANKLIILSGISVMSKDSPLTVQ